MNLIDNMLLGLSTALTVSNLVYCLFGVTLGTFVGVLPGIGSLAAISVLMPLTFYMDPVSALVMLAGIYYGSEYGGSTASILLNLPGGPSSAVTCLDGYPMAQQGRAGVALFVASISSFVGGAMGILLMMMFTPVLADIALSLQAVEYVAIMIIGLVAAGISTKGDPLRGLVMIVLGLLIGTVGVDLQSGVPRYTLGILSLYDGVDVVILAMGLFGVGELITAITEKRDSASSQGVTLRSMLPTRSDVRQSTLPTLRGGALGSLIGALPATGATLASYLAYAIEKRISKDPSRFGRGAIEGIASPESANNAAVQTAFIPTLSLGIPGSATMAIIMGAMMVHGIAPGPMVISDRPDLFWGLIASFWIGNLMLVILNVPLIGIWVRLLSIPFRLLYLGILPLICVGVFSLRGNVVDIVLVLIVGLFGYLLRLLRFEPAPLMIAVVLGPLLEENIRRAMTLGRGDLSYFFKSPTSTVLLLAAGMMVLWVVGGPLIQKFIRRPTPGAIH